MTRETAEQIASAAIAYSSENRWVMDGTKEKLVEAALSFDNYHDQAKAMSDVLNQNSISFGFSDPCDEVSGYHWGLY